MDKTLYKYLSKLQLQMLFGLLAFVFGFVFLFTFVDIMRRVPNDISHPLLRGIALTLCKSPIVFCDLFIYIYFISAVVVLWKLANSHQIIILKSIGKSPKQILFPFLSIGWIISLIYIFVMHPVCMEISKNINSIERTLIHTKKTEEKNIWISKRDNDNANEIIYIAYLTDKIYNISIFRKAESLFAESALITGKKLILYNGCVSGKSKNYFFKEKELPATLSYNDIKKFSVPYFKCSIYDILTCMFNDKFNVVDIAAYIIQLNKILSTGMMLYVFAMIAAVLCLPLNRYKTKTSLSSEVILVSIGSRVTINLCENIGYAGAMSPVLCIWAPIMVIFFISAALLIWKEA